MTDDEDFGPGDTRFVLDINAVFPIDRLDELAGPGRRGVAAGPTRTDRSMTEAHR